MTDTAVTLVWCAAILLVFCACGAAAEWVLRRRDHRRAVRRQLRRTSAYTATVAPPYDHNNVIELHPYSRKAPAA